MEPVWLSLELLTAIHDRQIAEHGGSPGIRDEGMLASALARPENRLAYGGPEVDVPALAASHAFGIARNHPFVEGNRPTMAATCALFLELNGYELLASDADLYPVFIQLAAGELDEDELTEWLREHSRPNQVNEPAGRYG